MSFQVERGVTVWSVEEDLPLIGNNSVASVDRISIERFARIEVDNKFTSFRENHTVDIPFCAGNCLCSDVLDVVSILVTHVNAHVCFRRKCVSKDVIGFDIDGDDSSVTCFIVQKQSNGPCSTLETSCCGRQVRFTEGRRWRGFRDVVGSACHGLSHPVGWTVKNPIGCERCRCSGCVTKVDGCIALHVVCSIATS